MRTRTTPILVHAAAAMLACRASPPPVRAAAEPVTATWSGGQDDEAAAARRHEARPLPGESATDSPSERPSRRRRAPLSGPFGYGFEELRSGRIDHVIHGAGPLWSLEEHDAYRRALADTPPYMVRTGINLAPQRRRTFDEQLRILRDQFQRYADQVPMLTISFNEKFDDGTARAPTLADWAAVFDAKRREIATARCADPAS